MDFRAHRPNKQLGRSERPLVSIATDLARFLTKAQRSLTFDTLHLASRQREALAQILVEFAEDLHQDLGIWSGLERYNLDFFGTTLPCIVPSGDTRASEPVTPERVQYLLWTLYSELEPTLILAPHHQDLARLAALIAAFLHERFTHVQFDSGVKTFLRLPNTYGWDVKKKLIWLGQHSYLFRLSFTNYVHAHGGIPDIPTVDDFICQATTGWSGLGVIDLLAALLDITDEQRAILRGWYERHTAYFRVVSVREPFLEVVNLLNAQPYTVRVEGEARKLQAGGLVYGSLVPWDGAWYWSGVQHGFATVPEELIQRVCKGFPLTAPHIVYRYCESRAEKAREIVSKHYQQFVDYYGTDLVPYPDGAALAEDLRQFYRYQIASAPPNAIAATLQKHALSDSSPALALPPDLLKSKRGIGVYFNPTEGQELMDGFNALVSGLQKHGAQLTEDEAESLRALLSAEAISPQFVRRLVQGYGDAAIAAAFLIPRETASYYLDYLLRRYKGHFYRHRYPSLTVIDH
jgi:Protein of unknown function (DUF3843)